MQTRVDADSSPFNLFPHCRVMLALHAIALCMELGVVGATIGSLLSELRNPYLSAVNKSEAEKRKTKEVVATSVSIVVSLITFCITIIGAGDFFTGVKIAGMRLSAAGRKMTMVSSEVRSHSRRQMSSRNCWSDIEDAPQDAVADMEASVVVAGDRQASSATQDKEL
jgi:hypothetical protein